MKKIAITLIMLLSLAAGASAQYYQIASQIPSLISPALSGSFSYKGFVEAYGLAGIGNNRANIVGVSTSQGFKYASWFFMGVGIGLDVAMSHDGDTWAYEGQAPDYWNHPSSSTKVMVPVFTDFRFDLGDQKSIRAYIDLKLGASWLMGSSYLQLQHGRLGGTTQFYLKPSVGIRIPVSKANPKQAVSIGLTYQMLTSNDNYAWWYRDGVTLSTLGLAVAFEW